MRPIPQLLFLTPAYGAVTTLRNWLFNNNFISSYSSKLFTISVGNISVGGNGKTPFVSYLAEMLKNLNFKPVILTRGYGSKITKQQQPYLVQNQDQATLVGDEPRLLSSNNPVVIACDRVQGAKYIEANSLGNIIILDDGFQHRRLKRDLNLVLERNLNLSEKLLPAGRLREAILPALKRCDALIEVDTPGFDQLKNVIISCRRYDFRILNYKIFAPNGLILNSFPAEFVAFCGIGQPKAFKNFLEKIKDFKVSTFKIYPDHYELTSLDLLELSALNLPLICTTKDAIKISAAVKEKYSIYTLEVEYGLIQETEFKDFVLSLMKKKAKFEI